VLIRRFVRVIVTLPFLSLLAGDAGVPGCGRSDPPPEKGPLTFTATLGGAASAALEFSGEWRHYVGSSPAFWSFDGETTGGDVSLSLYLRTAEDVSPPATLPFDTNRTLGGQLTVVSGAGVYCADPYLAGSSAQLTFERAEPPTGRISAVLVPCSVVPGPPGPEGTSVTAEIDF